MKTIMIAAALAGLTAQACAESDIRSQTGQGMSVEQKKTEIVQHIQDRITKSQAEMACVKSADSHEGLKACREKFRPQAMREGNERRDTNRQ